MVDKNELLSRAQSFDDGAKCGRKEFAKELKRELNPRFGSGWCCESQENKFHYPERKRICKIIDSLALNGSKKKDD